ncbi:unnamed protein product [Rotaria magnacalcarata]|nr:unnamed protein product [Rotaria magnacalcarata]
MIGLEYLLASVSLPYQHHFSLTVELDRYFESSVAPSDLCLIFLASVSLPYQHHFSLTVELDRYFESSVALTMYLNFLGLSFIPYQHHRF